MEVETAIARAIEEGSRKPSGRELMSGFMSKHFGGAPMNESNTGLGYRSPDGWMFGGYKNSLNKPSVYAGREFLGNLFGDGENRLQGGVMLGGATGYGRAITPVVMPQLVARMGDRSLALGALPPIKGVTPATIALQLRKQF